MSGSTLDIAFRYTDQEYVSRNELIAQLGTHFYEPMWKTILDYRKKYEVPLDVVQYNRLPFKLVLTPSILAEINSVELLLLTYTRRYTHLSVAEKYSTEKALLNFHHDIFKEELRMIASLNDIPFIERDMDSLISQLQGSKANHNLVKGYLQAMSHLVQHPEQTLDKQSLREMWNFFTSTSVQDSATFYRNIEPKTLETSVFGNEYDGAPVGRIPEMMNTLFSFYAADYELSPFIVSGIVYTYLLYVSPLPHHNLEAATLAMQQILCYGGYGPGVYYTSPLQYLVQRKDQFDKLLEEVRKTGDMTYSVLYIVKRWKDAIIWRLKQLQKIPDPIPLRGEVQVIEKTIEIPTEKIIEIPVDRIVEKIVEVPVDRVVEKIVEVPVDRVVEKIVEVPVDRVVEKIVEVPIERIVEKIVQVPVERIVENLNPNATERIVEKIVEVPVEKIVERIVEVPVDRIVEKIVERIVEVPVERVVERIVEVPVKSASALDHSNSTEDSSPRGNENSESVVTSGFMNSMIAEGMTAQELTEKFPLIKEMQAQFYLAHRQAGHYYTIDQYREFAKCAYETARTSMDALTSINLYVKTKIKNKFVYTPVV